MPQQQHCERCGYISSNKLCKACILLDGLNRGLPKLGIGKTPKSLRLPADQKSNNSLSQNQSSCGNCACKSKSAPLISSVVTSEMPAATGVTAAGTSKFDSSRNENIDF